MKHVKFNIDRLEPLDHEALLQKIIAEHESEGYRVIRLDKRMIPDAVAIKDGVVLALEADTSRNGHNATAKKYSNDHQYDDVVFETSFWEINYTTNDSSYTGVIERRPKFLEEHYLRALELRQEGMTYKEIKFTIEKEFDVSISPLTLHKWATGAYVPRYVTSGKHSVV